MPKAKSWILVLMCAAGLLLVACGQPKNRMRFTMDESGYYAVDIVHWIVVKGSQGEVDYYPSYVDGDAQLTFYYTGGIRELPTFPAGDAIQLTSYRLTWKNVPNGGTIPPSSGALDYVVQADPTGKAVLTFSLLAVPGATKETCTVLQDLVGDPYSDPNTFVGQLTCKGHLEIHGVDMRTLEDISPLVPPIEFTAAFADYVDPNKAH